MLTPINRDDVELSLYEESYYADTDAVYDYFERQDNPRALRKMRAPMDSFGPRRGNGRLHGRMIKDAA